MSSYYREQGFHSRKRLLRKLRYMWALLLLAVLIAGGLFIYDAVRQAKRADEASSPSTAVTSLVVANTQLQASAYFQFQSPKNWRAIANESRANHFVYRKYNGSLVEQEFVVDINRDSAQPLALVQTTHVLPVKISQNGKFTPNGNTSDHCKHAFKPDSKTQQIITYRQVTFACSPDNTNYIAVVGVVGGTDSMLLTRPDGNKATYNVTFKNLTAQPTSGDFENIVETFEVR